MKAEDKFLNQSLDFWANVKLISQTVGYTNRKTSQIKIPTINEISKAYSKLSLDHNSIIHGKELTDFGSLLLEYFTFRAEFLNRYVQPNLLDKNKVKTLYNELNKKYQPTCSQPMNKQKGDKKGPAYFTCIINMIIEHHTKGYQCNYDPKELPSFTENNLPVRSLSRRVDGTFPGIINPLAVWEIKEYYYTTTFGSRVADGVYETLLDGYELEEVRRHLNREIKHYLMVDDHFTWWVKGRSYLCRICDILHMGFITEALFGKEVVDRLPVIVNEWIESLNPR